MLLWITTQEGVDRLVPEFLNTIPILDLSALQNVDDLVSVTFLLCFLSDKEVKLTVREVVSLSNASLLQIQTEISQLELVFQVSPRKVEYAFDRHHL